jgi:hypothetical protein
MKNKNSNSDQTTNNVTSDHNDNIVEKVDIKKRLAALEDRRPIRKEKTK